MIARWRGQWFAPGYAALVAFGLVAVAGVAGADISGRGAEATARPSTTTTAPPRADPPARTSSMPVSVQVSSVPPEQSLPSPVVVTVLGTDRQPVASRAVGADGRAVFEAVPLDALVCVAVPAEWEVAARSPEAGDGPACAPTAVGPATGTVEFQLERRGGS